MQFHMRIGFINAVFRYRYFIALRLKGVIIIRINMDLPCVVIYTIVARIIVHGAIVDLE